MTKPSLDRVRDRSPRSVLHAALALALSFVTTLAAAQSRVPVRDIGITFSDSGVPELHFSVADLARGDEVRERLGSGIAQHLSVTVQAYRVGSSQPILERQATCAVSYDIFARQFVVRRGRRAVVMDRYEDVVEQCLVLRRVPLGNANEWRAQRGREVYFAVRAELNPISRRRCRELLRGGRESDGPIGPIVVNIVRREICEADRVVEFRSPNVRVPGAP
ncbi:MAG: hypothetical protein H6721_28225 [Sandaracinus sp.]|nr:hypothetical protein [Myxococcales bacterium]MCB9613599.1 hypothetical protein [Sandaracinus sp.]MCB9618130.1 hypothetical protein [Sandaracinus sp.]MCB9636016.1 hypothetical protein [Sandaracinus sp.]